MKKINKTLLLASTLFVSQAVTLSENAYADEGYDLNVELSTEESSDASLNDQVQPISQDQVDSYEDITLSSQSLDENEAIPENKELELKEQEENTSIEKEENEEAETRQEELTDEINDESEEKEERNDLVYYDDTNLDEILTIIDDVDAKTSENSQSLDNKVTDNQNTEDQTVTEETKIDQKVYYAPKATGVIVEEKNTTKY